MIATVMIYQSCLGDVKIDPDTGNQNGNSPLTVHYSDVMMSAGVSNHQRLEFTQPFVQAQIKEMIKTPRHLPLWGEFTGDRWIPRTKGQ